MKLSHSEEAYSRELYRAYKTYGSNIPDSEWKKIGELRAKYDIVLSRVREIINAVQEGTIAPSIEQAQPIPDKMVSSASISTDVASNMEHHIIENYDVVSDMRHHDNGNRNISYTSESNENYQDYIPVPINN